MEGSDVSAARIQNATSQPTVTRAIDKVWGQNEHDYDSNIL